MPTAAEMLMQQLAGMSSAPVQLMEQLAARPSRPRPMPVYGPTNPPPGMFPSPPPMPSRQAQVGPAPSPLVRAAPFTPEQRVSALQQQLSNEQARRDYLERAVREGWEGGRYRYLPEAPRPPEYYSGLPGYGPGEPYYGITPRPIDFLPGEAAPGYRRGERYYGRPAPWGGPPTARGVYPGAGGYMEPGYEETYGPMFTGGGYRPQGGYPQQGGPDIMAIVQMVARILGGRGGY